MSNTILILSTRDKIGYLKNWNSDIDIPFKTIGYILLITFLFIILYIISTWLKGRKSKVHNALREFKELSRKFNLSDPENALLENIAKASGDGAYKKIFSSINSFEKGIEQFMESVPFKSLSKEQKDGILILLTSIRKKLSFRDVPSFVGLINTRQIQIYQGFDAELIESSLRFSCRVLENNDDQLVISASKDEKDKNIIKPGMSIKIVFRRDEEGTLYEFQTVIHDLCKKPFPMILLNHTDDLKRLQEREYLRVRTNIAINFAFLSATEFLAKGVRGLEDEYAKNPHQGILTDLSGSGASLELPLTPSVRDRILFHLSINDGKVIKPVGHVLKVEDNLKGPLKKVGIEFENLSNEEEKALIQYVFDLQRQSQIGV